jgi:hypothetical protein
VKNEVGYQEKLKQEAEDAAVQEAAAKERGEETKPVQPQFVTEIRDRMLADSVPFRVAIKKQHRVDVTKKVDVTTDFVIVPNELQRVQIANLRSELMLAKVDEVTPMPHPQGRDATLPDSEGRLGNEYAQWWARTGALSRCPILPHPTVDWSDQLLSKAKRTLNRLALDLGLRPFQERLKKIYEQFNNGEVDFGEALVAVWQKCDAKMRGSMAHVPDPLVQKYCLDRLQAPSLLPPLDYEMFASYVEDAIKNAIKMKTAFEMDEEAEVQIAGSIEQFEAAKEAHQNRMAAREEKLKQRAEKIARKKRDQERKRKMREELQESLSRAI